MDLWSGSIQNIWRFRVWIQRDEGIKSEKKGEANHQMHRTATSRCGFGCVGIDRTLDSQPEPVASGGR